MRTQRLYPVDYVVFGYNIVLAAVWSLLIGRVDYAPLVFSAHVAAVFLPRLLERTPSPCSVFTVNLRHIYPLLWVLAFWTELDYLRAHLHAAAYDAPIIALDHAVFGVHLHDVWIAATPQVWLSELLHFCYFAYYPLIFVPPLVLAVQRRRPALRDVILRLTVTYLACYLVYVAFPVDGPHYLTTPYQGPLTDGFFYRLVRVAQAMGDSRGAAFPSSHVTGAVTIAIIGWRWFSRPVAVLLSLEAVGVVLSTVYTQNHYAVDSLAGLLWAVALQAIVVPALAFVLGSSQRSRLPVPHLPSYQPTLDTTGGGT
jgi:membrane-associated phospholipid phosphatase